MLSRLYSMWSLLQSMVCVLLYSKSTLILGHSSVFASESCAFVSSGIGVEIFTFAVKRKISSLTLTESQNTARQRRATPPRGLHTR